MIGMIGFTQEIRLKMIDKDLGMIDRFTLEITYWQ